MTHHGTNRHAILDYLDRRDGLITSREIATALKMPYKATIDALDALHRAGRIVRGGAKYSARWGSLAARQTEPQRRGWDALADIWFQTKNGPAG